MKIPDNKIKGISTLIAVLVLIPVLFLSLISCEIFGSGESSTVPEGTEVEFEIKEGMVLKEIAALLEEKGIIDNAFLFRLFVEQKGKEGSLIPGIYTLKTGSDYEEVLNEIIAGPPIISYKFTIPEGYTAKETIKKISEEIPFISYEEMKTAEDMSNYDYDFLEEVTILEGFLFPRKYEITIDWTAVDIIDRMIAQYKYETEGLDYSYAESKDLSNYEILIIASMIQEEFYIDEEMELISAVIYNRLDEGMTLDIDATLLYGLDKWEEGLTDADKKIDFPYNTYMYAGLPPTPICNPGLACIEAALNPEKNVEYFYYKITDTENHIHSFFEDYQDFINAEVK